MQGKECLDQGKTQSSQLLLFCCLLFVVCSEAAAELSHAQEAYVSV